MIKKVKTIWAGRVAVAQHEVDKAKSLKEPLIIVVGGDKMIIPFEQLDEKIVARSNQEYVDKFSGKKYRLVYYKWDPIKTLLDETISNQTN